MLRLIKLVLSLFLLTTTFAFGDGLRTFFTSAVAADASIPQAGTAIGFHKLSWTTSGTITTCTVALDTSSDGVSWNAGAAIAGQTCTSPGTSTVATVSANFIRINVTVISGGGLVYATWSGFVSNPATGAGTGACTNQVVTAVNAGLPTCSTVVTTMIGTLASGANGLAASATTDTTNATNIGSGTLNQARLPATSTQTIASGTSALGTSLITSAACATVVTTSATGAATTDAIIANFNGDPTAVTGYIPLSTGMLTIVYYPTTNNVNFKVCNNTLASITPGAITLNWRVVR